MHIDRRNIVGAAAGLGLATAIAPTRASATTLRSTASFVDFGPGRGGDVTSRLQRTIEYASALGHPIQVAPGYYQVRGTIRLMPGTKLVGPHGLATFNLSGNGHIIAENAADLILSGLTITGASNSRDDTNDALLSFNKCANLSLHELVIDTAPSNALMLWQCSGRIERSRFTQIGHTAINSGNAEFLDISHNHIMHAGNNGIVVWRDKAGHDGTTVTNNKISNIRSDAGGSGQNGNAINAFRANHVVVSTNTITACAYSAVRCNASSNAQILGNNCRDIGEVALYAEFGFEGAIIANNLVDKAATGIEVTNFKEGGRLATVQGNIIRNLVRRDHEPVDKRGVGISVEADTIVNANTIENAATAGISIGWGKWMRHVSASGNLIRDAAIGIGISVHGEPDTVLISGNIISSTRVGGVMLLDHDKPASPSLVNGTTSTPSKKSPAVLQGNLIS